jgi:hypothetical protein
MLHTVVLKTLKGVEKGRNFYSIIPVPRYIQSVLCGSYLYDHKAADQLHCPGHCSQCEGQALSGK